MCGIRLKDENAKENLEPYQRSNKSRNGKKGLMGRTTGLMVGKWPLTLRNMSNISDVIVISLELSAAALPSAFSIMFITVVIWRSDLSSSTCVGDDHDSG